MKIAFLAAGVAILVLTTDAAAQSAPRTDLTRMLNGTPPVTGPVPVPARPTNPVAPAASVSAASPPASRSEPSRPAAAPTILTAAAVAALPFTVDLPATFQMTTGRPGPDFAVYTVRKGQRPFVMIYVGPRSQYPIYDGEQVQLSGRSSIVIPEDGARRAVEHLFRSDSPARDIHVWVASLEGADRAQGEQIAQSVTPR